MLVLSRRPQEAVMIGHDIVVTVLSISRDHVRIGIQAPTRIEVHRKEVYLAIQEANRAASSSAAGSLDSLSGVVPGRKRAPDTASASEAKPSSDPQAPAGAEDGTKGTATP